MEISIIKGIHPGLLLERELRKRNIKKRAFAEMIHEHPQTLGAITKGKRRITSALSLELEKALGFEEGFFMILQAYYDIEQEKRKYLEKPDVSKFRDVLFWDTNIQSINWQKSKNAVIKRILERGNELEVTEIIRFYGKDEVKNCLQHLKNVLPTLYNNISKYL